MILVIDNYDSFTWNLVQYLGELGGDPEVVRNDAAPAAELLAKAPAGIVLSPGPKTPNEAGVCLELVREAAGQVPLLGVCLGHQCIGQAYGGEIVRAERLMHGKTSEVSHDGKDIFAALTNPFTATRYHSLVIRRESFPSDALELAAWTQEGEIMGVRHREHPLWGVQFHPESILTPEGKKLLAGFLERCR